MLTARRSRWWAALAAMAMSGAGCGSSDRTRHTAESAAVSVIRAWSTALRNGDVSGAARYFALPSEFVNGPDEALVIHDEGQAQAVNATLPCGAILISTERRGRYVSALFRLTNRPGGGCGSGTGQLARTNFVIAKGHIVEWIRAPTNGGGSPASPATPQGPAV